MVKFDNNKLRSRFVVTKSSSGNLLFYESARKLGIVSMISSIGVNSIINTVHEDTKQAIIDMYPSLFTGEVGEAGETSP